MCGTNKALIDELAILPKIKLVNNKMLLGDTVNINNLPFDKDSNYVSFTVDNISIFNLKVESILYVLNNRKCHKVEFNENDNYHNSMMKTYQMMFILSLFLNTFIKADLIKIDENLSFFLNDPSLNTKSIFYGKDPIKTLQNLFDYIPHMIYEDNKHLGIYVLKNNIPGNTNILIDLNKSYGIAQQIYVSEAFKKNILNPAAAESHKTKNSDLGNLLSYLLTTNEASKTLPLYLNIYKYQKHINFISTNILKNREIYDLLNNRVKIEPESTLYNTAESAIGLCGTTSGGCSSF